VDRLNWVEMIGHYDGILAYQSCYTWDTDVDFQQFVTRVAKTAKVRERSLFVQTKGWVA
jgi:hypothetical protein